MLSNIKGRAARRRAAENSLPASRLRLVGVLRPTGFKLEIKRVVLCVAGSAILAFGLYNVHELSGVTEGGVLGMTLLLHHWLGLSPAISGFVLNAICYLVGGWLLGRSFVTYSIISGGCFSAFYAIVEQFPHVWPGLANMALPAAIIGALFVGVGVGLCVRAGGAPSGDDALSMSVCAVTKWDIRWIYLVSDLLVLALSLTYLDIGRIAFSLLTVLLSGQIIGFMQKLKKPSRDSAIENKN